MPIIQLTMAAAAKPHAIQFPHLKQEWLPGTREWKPCVGPYPEPPVVNTDGLTIATPANQISAATGPDKTVYFACWDAAEEDEDMTGWIMRRESPDGKLDETRAFARMPVPLREFQMVIAQPQGYEYPALFVYGGDLVCGHEADHDASGNDNIYELSLAPGFQRWSIYFAEEPSHVQFDPVDCLFYIKKWGRVEIWNPVKPAKRKTIREMGVAIADAPDVDLGVEDDGDGADHE